MESKLRFLNTMSVADFKKEKNVEKIDILQSEITSKSFFSFGVETGACSHKVLAGKLTNPVISQVCSAETGETFWLLHQKGEMNATVIGSL